MTYKVNDNQYPTEYTVCWYEQLWSALVLHTDLQYEADHQMPVVLLILLYAWLTDADVAFGQSGVQPASCCRCCQTCKAGTCVAE